MLISSSPDFDVLNQQRVVVIDKLHSHVVGKTQIVNVFKADAVIWWAAIFRTLLIDVRQNAASVKVPGLCR